MSLARILVAAAAVLGTPALTQWLQNAGFSQAALAFVWVSCALIVLADLIGLARVIAFARSQRTISVIVAIITGSSLAVLGWRGFIHGSSATAVLPLRIEEIFVAPDWQGTSGFWAVTHNASRMVVVNAAVFVVIVNSAPQVLKVEKLSIQAKSRTEEWVTMTWVATIATEILFARMSNLDKATPIDLSPFLDRLLSERTLQPHDDIRGWLLMNYPPFWKPTAPLTFRLTLTDVSGAVFVSQESTMGPPQEDVGVGLRPPYFVKSDVRRDLSQLRIIRP